MTPIALRWLRAGAVLVTVGFAVGLRVLDGDALEAFDDIGLTIVPLTAAATCFAAARRLTGSRRAWLLLGLSALSWALGNAWWTYLQLVRGVFPFPSAADIGFLGCVPLAAAAMLAFPAAPERATARLRMLLDGVIVTASLLFCSWALVLGPVYAAGGGSILEQAITLAYPAGDLVIAVIVVLVLSRAATHRTPLALIGVGLLAAAVADSGFAVLVTNGTYTAGNLIDLGWVVGYLLIILAAAHALAQPHGTPGQATAVPAADPLWHIALPYVPIAGVILLAAWRRLSGDDLEPVLFWIAMVLLIALGARQIAAQIANRTLVAQLRANERQLAHQALHDPLTGLPNRTLFEDRVTHTLSRRGQQRIAVLFYDLDDFKIVNDTLGHHAGDALLRAVADRLRVGARTGDTVARLGGDEFAVLVEGVTDHTTATPIAQRLVDLADTPYEIDGHTMTVTGSIGIAVAERETDTADTVLRHADIAMYAAKARGKGRYAVYETRMHNLAVQRFASTPTALTRLHPAT